MYETQDSLTNLINNQQIKISKSLDCKNPAMCFIFKTPKLKRSWLLKTL